MYSKTKALSVFEELVKDLPQYEKEMARFGKRTQAEQIRVCGQALKIADWLKEIPELRDNSARRLAYALAIAETYCKKHSPKNGQQAADIAEAKEERAARNPYRGLPTKQRLYHDLEKIVAMKEKGMTYKEIASELRHSKRYRKKQPHPDTIRKFMKEIEKHEKPVP